MLRSDICVWAVAVQLAGVLIAETLWFKSDALPSLLQEINVPQKSLIKESETDDKKPRITISNGEKSEILISRPLFEQGRRPPKLPTLATSSSLTLPRLSGIVITSMDRSAIFAPAQGGKAIIAHEGSALGQWTVEIIGQDEVRVSSADTFQVLRPTYDPNPHPIAPAVVQVLVPLPPLPVAISEVPSRTRLTGFTGFTGHSVSPTERVGLASPLSPTWAAPPPTIGRSGDTLAGMMNKRPR